MKNKILLVIALILILALTSGCLSRKFEKNYNQFKESYMLATDFIEKDRYDPLNVIKMMDVKLVETELKKMKQAMDNMSTELNSKDEKGLYGNVENYYKGLEFLLYANQNFDNLTFDDKTNVYIYAGSATTNRDDIKSRNA